MFISKCLTIYLQWILWVQSFLSSTYGGGVPGQVVNVMNCDIVVSEFKLQPHYYIHFRINIPGDVWTPYPTSYGLNNTMNVLLQG